MHYFHSIHYIASGKGSYIMNNVSYVLEPGKVIVFVPDTLFEYSTIGTDSFEFYHIQFDYHLAFKEKQTWVTRPANTFPFPMFGVYSLGRPGEVLHLFERLYAAKYALDPLSRFENDLLFRELWLTVIKNIEDLRHSGDSDSAVESTLPYITEHYRKPLTIRELSNMAGLSPGYYCKQFNRLTGYNPKEFITTMRINKAQEMLNFDEFSLREIANYVGYDDEFYFSRVFKQVTGISPSYYAKHSRKSLDKC
jgi:AraC-like DNA-binding protein